MSGIALFLAVALGACLVFIDMTTGARVFVGAEIVVSLWIAAEEW